MVKPIKMVEKKEEGKEKIQNVVIQINDAEWDFVNEKFIDDIVTFADVAGYQVNGDILGIVKKEGGNIIIPMRRINRIETSFADKE